MGRSLFPAVQVTESYKDIPTLAEFVYNTSGAIDLLENVTMEIQTKLKAEVVSLKNMVLQKRLATCRMLLHHGGLCAYIN